MKYICQITMGEYPNWFECGKPAKYQLLKPDKLRNKKLHLCGIHARALARRKFKVQPL